MTAIFFIILIVTLFMLFALIGKNSKTNMPKQQETVKSEETETMVASALHELKAPLSRMRLSLYRLEKQHPNSEEILQMEAEIGQIEKTIKDFSVLASLDNSKLFFKTAKININSFLFDIVSKNQLLATENSVLLKTNLKNEVIEFSCQADLLGRVIDQLVTNAIKFSPEGSLVEVSADLVDTGLQIMVSDQGSGIPESELPSIIKPFVRGNTARELDIEGSGLGLAFATKACKIMDWQLDFINNSPSGLTVTVLLK